MHFQTYATVLACASSSLASLLVGGGQDLSKRDHPKDIKSPVDRRWAGHHHHQWSHPGQPATTVPTTAPTIAPNTGTATGNPTQPTQPTTPGGNGGSAPGLKKGIRGVNLGSYLLYEPWIAQQAWDNMGCSGAQSEYDCGKQMGQEAVDSAFVKHWESFYTQQDITDMKSAGLNTIRVPVGHWIDETTVNSDEIFPRGGFKYLRQLCGWATAANMNIIIDHHGAPGSQVPKNADTGHYVLDDQWGPNNFFTDANFERGLKFLEWMTTQIHAYKEFANVFAIQVINEPVQNSDSDSRTTAWTTKMRQEFYPNAYNRIRAAEQEAGKPNSLHIMYMNTAWWSGDPNSNLPSGYTNTVYDDHRYIKWANAQGQDKDSYMRTSCHDDRGSSDGPTITGEWSLSVDDANADNANWAVASNKDWYLGWFAAQARSYELQYGWIFWTWKIAPYLDDPRWSFKGGQAAGIIPKNLDDIYGAELKGKCNGF